MAKSTSRSISLDILRGIAVALMIIVNIPGSRSHVYAALKLSAWNGCTPADLVFSFFLFIAGISIWHSMKKYGSELNGRSILRISRRVLALFALGLLLEIFPHFRMDYSTLRIMGVLQFVALACCIASILCLAIRREYLWIAIAAILLLYWGLLAFFGGSDPFTLEGNLVRKIDLALLGRSHMYGGFGMSFEPYGLFSTLPAACTVMIGYYMGDTAGKTSEGGKTFLKLVFIGLAAVGLGLLWGRMFPINRPLWTSSYVLYTAGIAILALSVIYLLADVLKFRLWGAFFNVFGTNALVCYVLSVIWPVVLLIIRVPWSSQKMTLYGWLYDKVCIPVAGPLAGSLVFALIQMLIIWIPALILYRKKIMIRL